MKVEYVILAGVALLWFLDRQEQNKANLQKLAIEQKYQEMVNQERNPFTRIGTATGSIVDAVRSIW